MTLKKQIIAELSLESTALDYTRPNAAVKFTIWSEKLIPGCSNTTNTRMQKYFPPYWNSNSNPESKYSSTKTWNNLVHKGWDGVFYSFYFYEISNMLCSDKRRPFLSHSIYISSKSSNYYNGSLLTWHLKAGLKMLWTLIMLEYIRFRAHKWCI